MKRRALLFPLLLLGLLLADPAAVLAQESNVLIKDGNESIVVDPQTGDFIITYIGDDGTLQQVVWVPATKIKPKFRSQIKLDRKGEQDIILYRYRVRNGRKANQTLLFISLIASDLTETPPFAPNGWEGSADPNFSGRGIRVTWGIKHRTSVDDGLRPGSTLTGFGLESQELPGVGIARFHGSTPTLAFPDEGPGGKLGGFLEENSNPEVDSVPRHAAVPSIPIPDPFDAAVVLEAIQNHVQELVKMELVEPVFGGQLDAFFSAAIEALQRNDTDSAFDHFKELRHLIQQARRGEREDKNHKHREEKNKKHDDDEDWDDHKKAGRDRPITRLAARVLLFDVRFVAKRLCKELKQQHRSAKTSH
ncbi:MAG: hypothetical protein ACE5H7_06995 [Acidiferrobacterales bacterium]